MKVMYFFLVSVTAAILAVVLVFAVKMMQPKGASHKGNSAGRATDHHENAALLGEDQESIEIARHAPLTSDKGAVDSSLESDEVRRLLDENPSSPLHGNGIPNRADSSGFTPYGNDIQD